MILAAVLAGCCTSRRIEAVVLSAPGWSVREGQAIWRLPGDRPELAGELVVARHQDGRCLLQFTKTPFPLVTALMNGPRWQVDFVPQKRSYAGYGQPPDRLAWLQLARALAGQNPGAAWRFEKRAGDSWRLENQRSGEAIEGYLSP